MKLLQLDIAACPRYKTELCIYHVFDDRHVAFSAGEVGLEPMDTTEPVSERVGRETHLHTHTVTQHSDSTHTHTLKHSDSRALSVTLT